MSAVRPKNYVVILLRSRLKSQQFPWLDVINIMPPKKSCSWGGGGLNSAWVREEAEWWRVERAAGENYALQLLAEEVFRQEDFRKAPPSMRRLLLGMADHVTALSAAPVKMGAGRSWWGGEQNSESRAFAEEVSSADEYEAGAEASSGGGVDDVAAKREEQLSMGRSEGVTFRDDFEIEAGDAQVHHFHDGPVRRDEDSGAGK